MRVRTKGFLFFLALFFVAPKSSALALAFHQKTTFAVKNPAFLLYKENAKSNLFELFITSFGLKGQDHVSKISDLKAGVSSQSVQVEEFIPELLWPNEIVDAPESLFGAGYMIIPEGFLVPFKTNGAVELYDTYKKELRPLTSPKKGYWYHRVEFWDYNHDGRLDIVTARAKKGMMGGDDAELVVLLSPEDPIHGVWSEVILFKGPDVFFKLVDFNHDSNFEVIAAEFLSKKLSYYLQDEKGRWQEKIIDQSLGSLFDLELTDLNGDGSIDLLVTNHVNDKTAGVFAFEIPAIPFEQNWNKHILYQGFKTSAPGIGQASPGVARSYFPNKSKIGKPYVIVSGDGAEGAFLLSPLSQDKSDWSYKEEAILKTKGAVGQLAVGDADQNGLNEIYIPEYDQNRITVLEPENE